MYCKKEDLLFLIQEKREVMIQTAKEKGRGHEETIRLSQELDQLIYKYQLSFHEEKRRKQLVKNKPNLKKIIWSRKSRYIIKEYSEVIY